jgi:hypothetical protein
LNRKIRRGEGQRILVGLPKPRILLVFFPFLFIPLRVERALARRRRSGA